MCHLMHRSERSIDLIRCLSFVLGSLPAGKSNVLPESHTYSLYLLHIVCVHAANGLWVNPWSRVNYTSSFKIFLNSSKIKKKLNLKIFIDKINFTKGYLPRVLCFSTRKNENVFMWWWFFDSEKWFDQVQ